MKKYIGLFIAAVMTFTFCAIGCDTEEGGSSSSSGSGSGNTQVAITGFTIEPDGPVKMLVDATKDFTVSWTPSNANVFDLTWDVSGDTDIINIDTESILTAKKIIVKAVKEGTARITVSRIGDPSISKTLEITVAAKTPAEDGELAEITTVAVKINVTDVTMDDIFMVFVQWDTGTYDNNALFSNTNKIPKDKLTINKTDSKSGTVDFIIEDDNLSDGFTPYYDIRLVNSQKKTIGNLNINSLNVYQDTRVYKAKNKYYIEVDIDGVYGDAKVDMQ